MEEIEGSAEEVAVVDAEVEISPEQKAHKVFRHPEAERLHALLRRGKSAEWIALWLEEEYPLENDEGEPHENSAQHEKLRITPETIEGYRRKFMPECVPGIDVVDPELEDAIGRRFPAPQTPQFETEMASASVKAAERNLIRAMRADEQMGFVQPATLQAQDQLITAAEKSLLMKSKLGLPGYEAAPEKSEQVVHQTTRQMSVELHGKIDPKSGDIGPAEPRKVQALEKLMEMPPEKARELVEAAQAAEATEEKEKADLPSGDGDALELPQDDELDGDSEGDTGRSTGSDPTGGSGGASEGGGETPEPGGEAAP